jgi:hypothetical protein
MKKVTVYLQTLNEVEFLELEQPEAWARVVELLESGSVPVVTFDDSGLVLTVLDEMIDGIEI